MAQSILQKKENVRHHTKKRTKKKEMVRLGRGTHQVTWGLERVPTPLLFDPQRTPTRLGCCQVCGNSSNHGTTCYDPCRLQLDMW